MITVFLCDMAEPLLLTNCNLLFGRMSKTWSCGACMTASRSLHYKLTLILRCFGEVACLATVLDVLHAASVGPDP